MVVVGIDPGTKCGWCVIHADGNVDSGTWDLKGNRFEGAGMRFVRMRKCLRELLTLVAAGVVAFEEVRGHKGVDAAHVYGGIVAVVMEECELMGLPYQGVPVGTVKKFATGKGNAGKEAMMSAAAEKWPGWVGDDNEADARWIAACAKANLDGPDASPNAIQDTFKPLGMDDPFAE